MPGEGKHSAEWDAMFKQLVDDGMDEEQAAKICNSKIGFSADDPEVFEIPNVEIFAIGNWKGEEYTVQDLDNMVRNFSLLGSKYKAPLKLGHNEKQALAQADGYPAIGWVKELKRSGEKLLATFSNVPKKIKQLIDRNAYGKFSSEILWNFTFGGNVHKRVLRGVALLGADMPAVTSISDILALYSNADIPQGELHAYHDLFEKRKEGDKKMTVEELQKQIDDQKQAIAKFSQDIQSKDEKIKSLEAENAQRELENQKSKVFSAIDEGIKVGKIAPVQREYLASLAIGGADHVVKFSDGKEEKFNTPVDLLNQMISKLPVNEKFSTEQSTTGDDSKSKEKDDKISEGGRTYSTGAELDEKIKAIQKDKKNLTYAEAYQIAIQEVN